MKNKGKIGIFAVAGLGILAIVAFVFAWLTFPGGSGPGFSLPAETAGVGSPAELNWQDCTGCTVSVSGSDGTVLLEQRVSGSGTLSLPTEEAGDYAVSLYGLFGNLIQQDSYQVTENRIYTEQDTFQLGESAAVRIDTDGLELTDEAWIGIYERGATPGVDDSFLWVLVSDGLPGNGIYYAMQMRGSINLFLRYTGEYTAYLFTDGGYTPAASWDFSTVEEDGVLALRWDPDAHVDEPGDAQGFISLLGRPDAEDGEPVYICWGSDGEPLEGYDPLFILNAWDHYPGFGGNPGPYGLPGGGDAGFGLFRRRGQTGGSGRLFYHSAGAPLCRRGGRAAFHLCGAVGYSCHPAADFPQQRQLLAGPPADHDRGTVDRIDRH